MKVSDLLEMKTKGAWKITNLNGYPKTFKDAESPDALAWMKNKGPKNQVWDKNRGAWGVDPKAQEREDKKAEREHARLNRPEPKARIDYDKIYRLAMDAVGEIFPDGDPIDRLMKPITAMGVPQYQVGDAIEKAFRRFGKSKTERTGGMYGMMAEMWEDMARDAMHDAEQPNGEAREPFVSEKDGKPVMNNNPWLSNDEQKKIRDKHAAERRKRIRSAMKEGVLGSDHREKDDNPNVDKKFDADDWRNAAKGIKPKNMVVKPKVPPEDRFKNIEKEIEAEK